MVAGVLLVDLGYGGTGSEADCRLSGLLLLGEIRLGVLETSALLSTWACGEGGESACGCAAGGVVKALVMSDGLVLLLHSGACCLLVGLGVEAQHGDEVRVGPAVLHGGGEFPRSASSLEGEWKCVSSGTPGKS